MSNCWLVACIENSVFNDIDKEVGISFNNK